MMSTEKLSTILKLTKLFRTHSTDPVLFKSLFIAAVVPLITDLVEQNDKYITQLLFQLCKNELLSSKSIQSSLDIAYELIKNNKDKNKEKKENAQQENDENDEKKAKSILYIDDISQMPVNILSNVLTFVDMKELLTSTQFVSHQFIYAVRQPLLIHTVSHWLSRKMISFMKTSKQFSNHPLPSFYKLSQSVSHLSLQYNHSEDIFTDLLLFKMNFIPTLTALSSINIYDSSLWNHQPPSSNNITQTLSHICHKNKSHFKLIQLYNIRIDFALLQYISTNFANLKQLKISTRSIFKNVFFNHNNLNTNLLQDIEDIWCELFASKSNNVNANYCIINGQNQQNHETEYMELCKLRISKFLQFIIHKKLKKLSLHIKLRIFVLDDTFKQMETMHFLRDLTLSMHDNIKYYEWCSKVLNLTSSLEYFHLIFENFVVQTNNSTVCKQIFINLLKTLWNNNKVSIRKILFTMKWNAKIINHGYCELFQCYSEFFKEIIKKMNKNWMFRFEIYIDCGDCGNPSTIQLLNQLIEFSKLIKKYDNLSLVLQIGCFDDGINQYFTAKHRELSLFEKVDSLPSDYLSKTVLRAQL